MKENSTKNVLVKLLYNEASEKEREHVQSQMNKDWSLREDFNTLKLSKKELPQVSFSPKQSTLDKILRFSRNTALETHI